MQDKINILIELREAGADILTAADNKNYFAVPEGYFNDLTQNIFTNLFLKSLPNQNPYTVPAGYFESFSEILLEKLPIENGIDTIQKKLYNIPEGYFDNLADNILNKIKNSGAYSAHQELEALSPLLSSISKANVYSVPENYFNQLQPVNKLQEKSEPAAKVISIGSNIRKWMNYAAAACVAVVLFGGGYLYFSKNSVRQSPTAQPIAKMDVQKEISSLSDDEINNYLKDNNTISVYTNSNDADQPNLDVQTLLQNISDEEIQQYLNQQPEADETGGGI